MAEYIEREALLEKVRELASGSFSTPLIISAIENAPAVNVVEVVRCKDCVFYEEVEYYHPTENAFKTVCRLIQRQMHHNDFCSYGKRKEGTEG